MDGQDYPRLLERLQGDGVPAGLAERGAVTVVSLLTGLLHGGEVDILEAQLPQRLRLAVRARDAEALARADAQTLLARVGAELSLGPTEAERLVRAVFRALNEHLGEEEAAKVTGQLPADMRHLWVAPA